LKLIYFSDLIDVEPLQFWREHQGRFPAIASLARDVLSFPAIGAGVERLFNTARDICHYRRGRMKPETIEELMLFLCVSRFDLEEQQVKELEKFFSLDELEAAKEEKDEKPEEVEVEPISDTEEQDDESGDLIDIDDHDDAEVPLPANSTQLRVSGRKRRIREDDMYERY
jgi:hypothetical protein